VARVEVVRHHGPRLPWGVVLDRPDLDPKADVPALGGVDEGTLVLALEQDVAGVEVAQAHPPFAVCPGGQQHAAAEIEVEADAFRADQNGRRSGWRVRRFDVRRWLLGLFGGAGFGLVRA
jgi:hypothetical protein